MLQCSLFGKKLQDSTFNQQHYQHPCLHLAQLKQFISIIMAKGHFVTSTSLTNKVKIYHSRNIKPTTALLEQITAIYSCDSTIPEFLQVTLPAHQNGSADCGLFATAYATDLAIGNNPAEIIYDQCEMANHPLHCLQSNKIKLFLRFNRTRGKEQFTDITNNIEDINKWISPKKFSKLDMSQTKTAVF